MILINKTLRFLARDKLSVFLFHKLPSEKDKLVPNDLDIHGFERLMEFIREDYEILPLSDAVDRLQKRSLDRAYACITFDDGYPEWLNGVVPVLEKRSIPATFFITTGQLSGRPMWHERLANVLRSTQGGVLDTTDYQLPPLPVDSLKQRQAALLKLEFHFKYLPINIRDIYLEQLEAQVGVMATQVKCLTEDQLRNISRRGFDIGSHTVDHPILSMCDANRARNEIGATREILEGITGIKVESLAYPNGRPNVDFTHRHIAMAREAGYAYAVTTQWGAATCDTSLFQIPRFTPWGPDPTHMTLQLIRNLLAKPEYIVESS